MDESEITRLVARNNELERLFALWQEEEEVRATEFRSLQFDLDLQRRYVKRLERMCADELGHKDVHIRNLEATIAQLRGEQS